MLPGQIKNVGKMISYQCIFARFFVYYLCRLHMWSGHRALTGNYTKTRKLNPKMYYPTRPQRQILNQMKPSSVTFKCSSNNLRQLLTTNVLSPKSYCFVLSCWKWHLLLRVLGQHLFTISPFYKEIYVYSELLSKNLT